QLDGVSYGVATIVYDPDVHYHEVRRKWWSISITDRDGRRHHVDLWSHRGRHHGPRDGGWNTTTYK
ncbi:MAG: hypothetical protein AAFV26_05360, partial [Pseudomonadota bacterium]